MQNFCIECGYKIDIGSKYCPECGTKIDLKPHEKITINKDIKTDDTQIKQIDTDKKFKLKYLYIFLVGVILHMTFAGENTFTNYLVNTSSNPAERTISGLLIGLYGTFAYAGAGMIFSLLIFAPIIYFTSEKNKRNLYKSAAYAICIGVVFRILSYFF